MCKGARYDLYRIHDLSSARILIETEKESLKVFVQDKQKKIALRLGLMAED